jgi:LacI family transcriptional regulator
MAFHSRPNPLQATLKDVASLAGVSIKTVSRVVNDQDEVSDSTRKRVQAAIDKLGYRPNILARSLVNGETKTLAAVVWGIDYYGPSRTIIGIERKADELGYSLFLELIAHPDEPNVGHLLDELVARRVDGIIWAVPEVGKNRSWFKRSLLKRLPPIVFLSMNPKLGLAVAAVDNRAGAFQAVRHLFEGGRRKIGLITGPLAWWEARERYAGWEEALTQLGLPVSPSLVVEGDRSWSAESGERGLRTLLNQEPDIDAAFICNDQMALGAMFVAHLLGRRVPQDLAIVGFDNIPESAFFTPPLTTVHQNLSDVGYLAVDMLHEIIQANRQNESVRDDLVKFIQPELVIRASSV